VVHKCWEDLIDFSIVFLSNCFCNKFILYFIDYPSWEHYISYFIREGTFQILMLKFHKFFLNFVWFQSFFFFFCKTYLSSDIFSVEVLTL
jgi:hypothetical protein